MFRALFILFLAAILQGCGAGKPHADGSGMLVRLADDDAKSLDPQKASDLTSLRIASDQFEGLTRHAADGSAEAGLASIWQVEDNGLRWRFHLRPGLRFSDGTPITARSFAQVFARLRAPATASPNAALFAGISSITAPAPDEVVVQLKTPFPALAELLAHPAIAALPMHRIARMGADWTKDRPLVTSGPYQLAEWRLNDHVLLVRNPNWHDRPAPIAHVEWRPAQDRQSALRQFLGGEADTASDFPTERLEWLNRHRAGQAHVAPYRGSYYFVFNTRRAPFADKRVRKALNLALERRLIASRIVGAGEKPAWAVVPPRLWSDAIDDRPGWADWPRQRRLSAARQLLADAGYDEDHPLDFEIRFNSSTENRRIILAMIDNWRELPVHPRLLNTEATLHFASMRRGDFQLARSGWIGDLSAPENFLAIYRCDAGPINYSGYCNPLFDHALSKAMAIDDPARRQNAMRQAEEILIGDAPVLPVHFYVSKALVSMRVAGWVDNLANVHPSRTLRLIDR